jgi:hypothetical protein
MNNIGRARTPRPDVDPNRRHDPSTPRRRTPSPRADVGSGRHDSGSRAGAGRQLGPRTTPDRPLGPSAGPEPTTKLRQTSSAPPSAGPNRRHDPSTPRRRTPSPRADVGSGRHDSGSRAGAGRQWGPNQRQNPRSARRTTSIGPACRRFRPGPTSGPTPPRSDGEGARVVRGPCRCRREDGSRRRLDLPRAQGRGQQHQGPRRVLARSGRLRSRLTAPVPETVARAEPGFT